MAFDFSFLGGGGNTTTDAKGVSTTPIGGQGGQGINWLALAPMLDMFGQNIAGQTGGNNPLGGVASKYAPQLAQAKALAKGQAEQQAWRKSLLDALGGNNNLTGAEITPDGGLKLKAAPSTPEKPGDLSISGSAGVDSLMGGAGADSLLGGGQAMVPFGQASSVAEKDVLLRMLAGPDTALSEFDLAALSPEQQLAVVQAGLAGQGQSSKIVSDMYDAMLKRGQLRKAEVESQVVDLDLGGKNHKVRLSDVPEMYKNFIDQQYRNGQLRIDDEKNRIAAAKAEVEAKASLASASKDRVQAAKAEMELKALKEQEKALNAIEASGVSGSQLGSLNAGTALKAGIPAKDLVPSDKQTLAAKLIDDKKKVGRDQVYKNLGANDFSGLRPESQPLARMSVSIVEGMLNDNADLEPATLASQANSAAAQYFDTGGKLTPVNSRDREADLDTAKQMLKYVRGYSKYLDMNDLLQPFRSAGYTDEEATVLIQQAATR